VNEKTGRIRLDQQHATFLYWVLADERLRLLDERRAARAIGVSLTSYQQMTALVRDLRTQIELTAEECGWDLGSPEYEN
jgi:hypothetical protein